MTVHLIKLCVGCDTVQELEDWIAKKLHRKKKREHIHTTRMVPKRADELTQLAQIRVCAVVESMG